MGRIIDLTETLQHEVESYSGPSIKARTLAFSDPEKYLYGVLMVPDFPRKFDASIMVLARLANGKVVIEEGTTDLSGKNSSVQGFRENRSFSLMRAKSCRTENT
jgi:hypothetical protein